MDQRVNKLAQIEPKLTRDELFTLSLHPTGAAYKTANLNAEIRRVKVRLAELEKLAAAPEVADTDHETSEGVVTYSECDNRVQLHFQGKPSESTRELLKSRGFRWAPSASAWQRQLTEAGRWAAESVLKSIAAPKDEG